MKYSLQSTTNFTILFLKWQTKSETVPNPGHHTHWNHGEQYHYTYPRRLGWQLTLLCPTVRSTDPPKRLPCRLYSSAFPSTAVREMLLCANEKYFVSDGLICQHSPFWRATERKRYEGSGNYPTQTVMLMSHLSRWKATSSFSHISM